MYASLTIGAAELRRAAALAVTGPRRPVDRHTVAGVVLGHAAEGPDRPAIVTTEHTHSFGDLVARVDALARALTGHGCAAGDMVAVAGPRGPATIVAFLATELIGAAYLPIDDRWPAGRLAEVLGLARPRAVVLPRPAAAHPAAGSAAAGPPAPEHPASGHPASGHPAGEDPVAAAAAEAGVPVVEVDTSSPTPTQAAWPTGWPTVAAPDELRYVLFTSGSTGTPKGALVEHQGMLNHLYCKVAELELGPADAVAFTAPVAFDISIWQMLVPLLVGGRVVVVPDEVVDFPRRLLNLVDRLRVTTLELVPTAVRLFLDEIGRRPAPRPLPWLRHLMATGEALPGALAGSVLDRLPEVRLINAYGPTECSDDVTHHTVRPCDATAAGPVPIGAAIPNTSLYVLREEPDGWRACRHGEVGELFVGGVAVGRGYLDEPGRTREAFFIDPFDAGSSTGRLYRTGDLARVNADGVLEYLGRTDRQVKISGVRMELAEIENRLLQHADVSLCAVVVRDGRATNGTAAGGGDGAGRRELVAYCVPAGDGLRRDDLDAFLRACLPAAMVPRTWVVLDRLPLTRNGKVDYAALPEP